MMSFIYSALLGVYYFLILIASPFNVKARNWIQGRKGLLNKLEKVCLGNEKIVWFHSASLGEFEQGRPVIEELKKQRPELKILLTFFSPSGFEIRKNYKGADYIYYLPMDFKHNAKRFIDIINPVAAYFIKYEFWHNYLNELKRRQIPVYCFSSNFRPDQLFFKRYGGWYRQVLYCFTHLYVQNQKSKDLLEKIGLKNVTVSGDTRFDRVFQIASQAKQLPAIEKFKNNFQVIIAGSTWPADEDLLVSYINQSELRCKFIIAPHELHSSNIEKLVSSISKKVIKYSETGQLRPEEYDVLIIDNIGMLSSVYQYGNVAYIGGGFGKGIHNILEAATFGLPIVFGSNFEKFQEAHDLVKNKGAYTISSFGQFKKIFDMLLSNTGTLQASSLVCKSYVADNTGSTNKILSDIHF